ncbi:polyprotein [Frankliniella fusca]|uniref:Polyprotein n=1 Tax=Frankliniella fusca TaxID=407009 RepID=A0AAE1HZQ4_9NEOP|nr:polyprotein [Frankliniella fusca]
MILSFSLLAADEVLPITTCWCACVAGHAHHGHRGSSSKLRHSRHLLDKPGHTTAELYSDQDLGFGGTASERQQQQQRDEKIFRFSGTVGHGS